MLALWCVHVSHAEAVLRHGAKCVDLYPLSGSVRAVSDPAIMHTGEWEHLFVCQQGLTLWLSPELL